MKTFQVIVECKPITLQIEAKTAEEAIEEIQGYLDSVDSEASIVDIVEVFYVQ